MEVHALKSLEDTFLDKIKYKGLDLLLIGVSLYGIISTAVFSNTATKLYNGLTKPTIERFIEQESQDSLLKDIFYTATTPARELAYLIVKR